jgi:hypothetical protein
MCGLNDVERAQHTVTTLVFRNVLHEHVTKFNADW